MWILGLKGLNVVRKPVPCVEEGYTCSGLLLETFRFEDEYDINYEFLFIFTSKRRGWVCSSNYGA